MRNNNLCYGCGAWILFPRQHVCRDCKGKTFLIEHQGAFVIRINPRQGWRSKTYDYGFEFSNSIKGAKRIPGTTLGSWLKWFDRNFPFGRVEPFEVSQ